jgi:nucleoprotein TPR
VEVEDENSIDVTDLGVLSPTADAARKFQKTGKSLTEIYSEYSNLKTKVSTLLHENEHLKQMVDQMVNDVEVQSLSHKRDMENYSKLKNDANLMVYEIEKLVDERNILRNKTRELEEHYSTSEKEIKSLMKSNQDLARQVQTLLHNQVQSNGNQKDSDQVISDRLVPFRNIQELQTKNQELLKIVRLLSEEKENVDQNAMSNNYAQRLETATKELKDLQEDRKREKQRVETLIKQRDMYKEIAESKNERRSPIQRTGSPSHNNQKLVELQQEYTNYRLEKEQLYRELNVELEQARSELTPFKIQVAKYESEIKFLNEKYDLLAKSSANQVKEMDAIRKANEKYSASMLKQQKSYEEQMQELISAKENTESLRIQISGLKSENELLRNTNKRLMDDQTNSHSERMRLEEWIKSLQRLSSELEHSEVENKRRLARQVESLETELDGIKKQLFGEQENFKLTVLRYDNQLNELRGKNEKLVSDLHNCRQELLTKTQGLEELTGKNKELVDQINVLESLAKPDENVELTREKQLEINLREARLELVSVKDDLIQALQDVDQYKAISTANEEALAELSKAYDTFKETKEKEISDVLFELEKNKTIIKSLNENISVLNQENQNNLLLIDNLKVEMNGYASRMKSQEEIEAEYNARELQLQQSVRDQALLTQEAQANYERELMMHANDLKTFNEMKHNLESLKKTLQEQTRVISDLQHQLASLNSEAANAKAFYEESLVERDQKLEEFKHQNALLLDQLETLNKATTKFYSLGEESTAEPGSDEEHKLLGIIKFLRREKDMLSVQYELLQQESKRIKTQYEIQLKNQQEMYAQLEQQVEKGEILQQRNKEYEELLSKVHQLNILRESNTTLRRENEVNIKKMKALQTQLEEEKAKYEPLLQAQRSLESEVSVLNDEKRLLTEESNRWKERVNKLLVKYERIDPVEFQKAIEEKSKAVKDLEDYKVEAEGKIKKFSEHIQAYKTKSESVIKKMKELLADQKEHASIVQELKNTIETLKTEKETFSAEIETLKKSSNPTDVTKINELQAKVGDLQNKLASSQMKSNTKNFELEKEVGQFKGKVAELEKTSEELNSELHKSKEKVAELEKDLEEKNTKLQKSFHVIQRLNQVKISYIALQEKLRGGSSSPKEKAPSPVASPTKKIPSPSAPKTSPGPSPTVPSFTSPTKAAPSPKKSSPQKETEEKEEAPTEADDVKLVEEISDPVPQVESPSETSSLKRPRESPIEGENKKIRSDDGDVEDDTLPGAIDMPEISVEENVEIQEVEGEEVYEEGQEEPIVDEGEENNENNDMMEEDYNEEFKDVSSNEVDYEYEDEEGIEELEVIEEEKKKVKMKRFK